MTKTRLIQHLAPATALALALALGGCKSTPPEPPAPAPAAAAAATAAAAPAPAPAAPAPAPAAAAEPAAAPAAAPDPAPPRGRELAAGDPAPDVTLTLTDGSQVALASLKGKRVLIYFYPKDDTPGCTAEATGIRDAWPDLQAAGLVVYGVSTQDADSHQAFIDKYSLPFPLAVDDGALADAFQVPRRFGLTARQSFLVGVDGKLEHVWREVSAASHAADVLAVIR